jgi:hypothetical protein
MLPWPGRFAFTGFVFRIRVKQPRSIAGRCWNGFQNTLFPLQVLAIVLKLTGVIDWSWWWVLAPLCISGIQLAIVLSVLLPLVLVLVLARVRYARSPWRRYSG